MMHGVTEHQGFGSATFYTAYPDPEPNMVADPAKGALIEKI